MLGKNGIKYAAVLDCTDFLKFVQNRDAMIWEFRNLIRNFASRCCHLH